MEGLGEDGKVEKKQRRKHNRFNGMSEEDVMKRLLPDLIMPDLDILIVSSHKQDCIHNSAQARVKSSN